jgi:hypothetical protein
MTHPFELAGLGTGPFRFVKVKDLKTVCGECDYCGTPIRWACHVVSQDSKKGVVGTTCIKETGDARLLSVAMDAKKLLLQPWRAELDRVLRSAPPVRYDPGPPIVRQPSP